LAVSLGVLGGKKADVPTPANILRQQFGAARPLVGFTPAR